ncbi:hypothetical protein Q3G72_016565 [Acer saccharum]|nr:hypothetical protein Q3G72_016565 [Acer saccharum]
MNPVFEGLASSYSDVLFLTVDVDDVKVWNNTRFWDLMEKFKGMPSFDLIRHAHEVVFEKLDLFFVCILKPVSSQIKVDDLEIQTAKEQQHEITMKRITYLLERGVFEGYGLLKPSRDQSRE